MDAAKPTAGDIYKLLEQRYPNEKYLTVPECKIGSSWFKPRCSRFDMWAMARSWAHPRFIGCEIKVSRQDFLNDTKWPDYLPYCTEFYFVSPHDVIHTNEVPEQAGLIVGTKNCKRLITKKKAPVREVDIPQSILIYILMSRSRITAYAGRSGVEAWKDRLREIEGNKNLGHTLAFHIRRLSEKKVGKILEENRLLLDENRNLRDVKEVLNELNIPIENIGYGWRSKVRRKLQESIDGIPFDLPQYLEQVEQNARMALDILENASDKPAVRENFKTPSRHYPVTGQGER